MSPSLESLSAALMPLLHYINSGGPVMWPLLLCCLVMLYLAAGLLLPTPAPTVVSPCSLNWLWQRQQKLAQQRALASQRGQLQGLTLLATTAPLLGLLGTVTAMISMFNAIGSSGLHNANALSDGIAEAMISTQTGLLIGAPGLLLAFLWQRRLKRLQQQWQALMDAPAQGETADAQ